MISLFCCRLICGAAMCWALMPRQPVTAGFFRIQHLVVLGLSVLATMTLSAGYGPEAETLIPSGVTRGVLISIAVVAYVGSVIWTLGRRRLGLGSILLILGLSCLAVLGSQPLFTTSAELTRTLVVVSEFTSAWLIGTAVTGMLLGHWYLTATSMSLTPLIRLNQFFLSASVLRAVVVGAGLATCPSPLSDTTHLVWLLLRWLSGILGPFVMSLLIWRILKYRNTQSATGVWFAGVILVFMGEMAATLLSNEVGYPL